MGKKDFDNFVIDDIDYYEYDCFDYCTPDGCKGHVTDIPVSFCFNGIQFFVEGFESGAFPGKDENHIKKVQETFKIMDGKSKLNKKGLTPANYQDNEIEYDYCTPEGCLGLEISIAFCFNGIKFYVEGAEDTDFCIKDKEHIKKVKDTFEILMNKLALK